MVSSPRDRIDGDGAVLNSSIQSNAKADWTAHFDREQIFRLIDSILPFEACLYHQILPLSLEGSRLKLGMVNLDDSTALDYVRRILAYMNCSLVPQTLASSIHHAALSAYLNYTGSQKQIVNSRNHSQAEVIARRIEKRLAQETANNEVVDNSGVRVSESERSPEKHDPNSSPTFLVDCPEDLNFQDMEVDTPPASPAPFSALDQPDPSERKLHQGQNNQHPTYILKTETGASAAIEEIPPEVPAAPDSLPTLEIKAKHLSDPAEVLAKLPPSELLHELLGRVLLGGIGRLYLERQPGHARILWSQNGVLQSVLEELPFDTLQGVINELKLLTRLPMLPVQKTRQVEIERLYQRQRLLLRLRVMPGNYGEEATMQVLRGAALKFYQQQQLTTLSRDALNIAQELQQKVNEIRVRTRFYPMLTADQLSILPALDDVLKSVEQQLEALKSMQLIESNPAEGGDQKDKG
jgi:type II secretory ATPase GspE/PulE/Tfp pilus assembly ATPase PilB-like protein